MRLMHSLHPVDKYISGAHCNCKSAKDGEMQILRACSPAKKAELLLSLYAGKNIQLSDDNILLVILRKLSAAVPTIEHSVALVQVGLYNCALVILLPTPHSNNLQVYLATLYMHDVLTNLSAVALTVGHA